MTDIITLDQAKAHLRVDTDDDDADITLKIAGASGAVLNYLKIADIDDLAVGSPPEIPPAALNAIISATLLMLGWFYSFREGDGNNTGFTPGYLPAPVTALLYPLRDPAFA